MGGGGLRMEVEEWRWWGGGEELRMRKKNDGGEGKNKRIEVRKVVDRMNIPPTPPPTKRRGRRGRRGCERKERKKETHLPHVSVQRTHNPLFQLSHFLLINCQDGK